MQCKMHARYQGRGLSSSSSTSPPSQQPASPPPGPLVPQTHNPFPSSPQDRTGQAPGRLLAHDAGPGLGQTATFCLLWILSTGSSLLCCSRTRAPLRPVLFDAVSSRKFRFDCPFSYKHPCPVLSCPSCVRVLRVLAFIEQRWVWWFSLP